MIYARLGYDPAALTPVSLVSNSPYVLAVAGLDGVKDLPALAAYAQKNPGTLNFGSAGNGSSPHLGLELFKLATHSDILHVPFKSGAEAVNAALGGQVQIVIDAIPVIQPQARAGKLRMLAIAADHRNPAVPDLPSSKEQGLGEFQIGSWNALLAPPGTPSAQVALLDEALARALKRPALVARLAEMGIEPLPTGAAAYGKHLRAETEKWTRVVHAAGTKVD